ncbi:MAG: hypothetical protein QW128_06630 [Thermoprotei archaeon]
MSPLLWKHDFLWGWVGWGLTFGCGDVGFTPKALDELIEREELSRGDKTL